MLDKADNSKESLFLLLEQTLTGMESPDKLVIHTSDGIILGRLAYKDDFKYDENMSSNLSENNRNTQIFFSTAYKTLKLLRDEDFNSEEINFPKGLWLKDVVINPNNQDSINLSYYFLFFEQVIGVTAGSLNLE